MGRRKKELLISFNDYSLLIFYESIWARATVYYLTENGQPGYVTKPVSKDELVKRVNEMLTDNNYHLTNSKNRRAGNNK